MTAEAWPRIAFRRFLLYAYDWYYPGGGHGDFEESFDSVNQMIDYLLLVKRRHCDNVEALDLWTGKIVSFESDLFDKDKITASKE